MSQSDPTERFLFHANAMAAGGWVSKPFTAPLPTQASVVLPVDGGHGMSEVHAFAYQDILKFDAAFSTVSGKRDGDVYRTFAEIIIEKLDVRGILKIDKLVGRLQSIHTCTGADCENEVSIELEHSELTGVTIVDPASATTYAVTTSKHAGLLPSQDFPGVLKALAAGPDIVDPAGKKFSTIATPQKKVRKNAAGKSHEDYTLITYLYGPPTVAKGLAHQVTPSGAIQIPDFGTVHFGELIIGRYSRRLTMVRLALGSPVDGTIDVGTVEANGSDYP